MWKPSCFDGSLLPAIEIKEHAIVFFSESSVTYPSHCAHSARVPASQVGPDRSLRSQKELAVMELLVLRAWFVKRVAFLGGCPFILVTPLLV